MLFCCFLLKAYTKQQNLKKIAEKQVFLLLNYGEINFLFFLEQSWVKMRVLRGASRLHRKILQLLLKCRFGLEALLKNTCRIRQVFFSTHKIAQGCHIHNIICESLIFGGFQNFGHMNELVIIHEACKALESYGAFADMFMAVNARAYTLL